MLKTLSIENLVWIIYAIFAIGGIYANNLEIEDIENRSQKNKKIMKNRGLGTVSFSSLFRSLNSVGIFILFVQREK